MKICVLINNKLHLVLQKHLVKSDLPGTSSTLDMDMSASDPDCIPDEEDFEFDDAGDDSDIDGDIHSQSVLESSSAHHKERKYIVFLSALHKLVAWIQCPRCGSHGSLGTQISEVGTLVIM